MYLHLFVLVVFILLIVYLFGLSSVKEFCSEVITDERLRKDVKECAVETMRNNITPDTLVKVIVPSW
ncbi:hypothetical protein BQ9231_00481 [Cedratvirus lausannensis]|uniref:Uncharacterized protein n=1 Tax=Cedratvirus lausannensis TaxID=2023205 RepID=A0A285PXK0_9VIRU|nr:hypothetical protein Cplu_149 [Cedratvirus plubellavi]SOB74364.1 hypothetical protein BQ9231_00481 [Cedratvirus lausannensis]